MFQNLKSVTERVYLTCVVLISGLGLFTVVTCFQLRHKAGIIFSTKTFLFVFKLTTAVSIGVAAVQSLQQW